MGIDIYKIKDNQTSSEPANPNIQEHIATVEGNPHEVTLLDVGGEQANPNIQEHIATEEGNPHKVTLVEVGGEPENPNIQEHIGKESGNPHKVTNAELGAEPANANIQTHISDITGNPHSVSAEQTGAEVANENIQIHIAKESGNPHKVTLAEVGGASSDHNHDSVYIKSSEKGSNSGVATLDEGGKIPSGQLPSYVDEVIEVADEASLPLPGVSGKIYIVISPSNLAYRWGGTVYSEISPSIALGENASTAYAGDKGKVAYDHSLVVEGNPHKVTASEVKALADTHPAKDVTAQKIIDWDSAKTHAELETGNPHKVKLSDVGGEPANENIQTHIATVAGNPHGTLLGDVGGEPVNENIQTHISKESGNPHKVKLSDVGGEPANENIQTHIATVAGNPHGTSLGDVGGEPANENIQTHISKESGNPHKVTKSEVSLGNVENLKLATFAEATAAVPLETSYMTPLRTKEAIEEYGSSGTDLELGESSTTAYYGDKGKSAYDHSQLESGNPHAVTKSNVGLGSVYNYGKASKADAEEGTSDAKYMTPLRTKNAIDVHDVGINSHGNLLNMVFGTLVPLLPAVDTIIIKLFKATGALPADEISGSSTTLTEVYGYFYVYGTSTAISRLDCDIMSSDESIATIDKYCTIRRVKKGTFSICVFNRVTGSYADVVLSSNKIMKEGK